MKTNTNTLIIASLAVSITLGVAWWRVDIWQSVMTTGLVMRRTWNKSPVIPSAKAYAYQTEPLSKINSLRFPVGPKGGAELAPEELRGQSIYGDSALKNRHYMPPMAIYGFDPNSLIHGVGPETAGYFYYAEDAEDPDGIIYIEADIELTNTGKAELQVGHGGPFPQSVADALNQLEAMEQIRNGSYEARLLYGGGPLGYVAIWLKAGPGETDLIYPINGWSQPGLTPGKLYPIDEFLKINATQITQSVSD